jgi:hypothetical protein
MNQVKHGQSFFRIIHEENRKLEEQNSNPLQSTFNNINTDYSDINMMTTLSFNTSLLDNTDQHFNKSTNGLLNESITNATLNDINYRLDDLFPIQRAQTLPIDYKINKNELIDDRPNTIDVPFNAKNSNKIKPYTPIHTSLLNKSSFLLMDHKTTYKTSLSRRLCILLWILESMNVESPFTIGPLRTCFLINDLGGEKISEKAYQKMKTIDVKWNQFKKSPQKQSHRFMKTGNDSARVQINSNNFNEQKTKRVARISSVISESGLNNNITIEPNNSNEDDTSNLLANSKINKKMMMTPSSSENHDLSLGGDDNTDDDNPSPINNQQQFESSSNLDFSKTNSRKPSISKVKPTIKYQTVEKKQNSKKKTENVNNNQAIITAPTRGLTVSKKSFKKNIFKLFLYVQLV